MPPHFQGDDVNLFYYMWLSLWMDMLYPVEFRPAKRRSQAPEEDYEP